MKKESKRREIGKGGRYAKPFGARVVAKQRSEKKKCPLRSIKLLEKV